MSSLNAIKHGFYAKDILINSAHIKEDPEEYQLLLETLMNDLESNCVFQELLVRRIANCMWRHRRILRAETAGISLRSENLPEELEHYSTLDKMIPGDDEPVDSAASEVADRAWDILEAIHSIPRDNDLEKTLYHEMRLDRQLALAYRLLHHHKETQAIETETIPEQNDKDTEACDNNKNNKKNKTNPNPDNPIPHNQLHQKNTPPTAPNREKPTSFSLVDPNDVLPHPPRGG